MRIGEIAEITGISVSNVRFYEKKGLLTPARESENNYREYSQEDVARIKEILLYRKIGMPIETIYLIFQGQIGLEQTLVRQKQQLTEQVEQLQAAVCLCDMMIEAKQDYFDEKDVDRYLAYVHHAEQSGKHFPQAAELVEDLTDYTIDAMLPHHMFYGLYIRWPLGAKILSFLVWGLLFVVPIEYVVESKLAGQRVNYLAPGIYQLIIAIYGYGFMKYRKNRKLYEDNRQEGK